ncbi:MerR family transcriptional regulator [Rhodospirillum rubrum]|uniref:Transcriptional regulator, MerR family n=1 Tax=Rhodospirillum rubrum (strain ATCC 11170 / ATH 1.1.1 / DSM 467 / LMG 4362 / NCIMB 8255 / S1) TaxID=269796 RepID=Q2RTS6_RHORT|nr:MerR family transcriptional regulator [Rhodospirillum rubrum]ABC22469.1 transcriptional regulator, MerR family [Rhodospirillum rubrum ATCC 11170]AEO48186.1 MerR family transcriptional regulator [Rhodospirillum rubrum F11]MBK5954051.1 MerR family transcriptional regulator [Rhodospirillum rubrum]QXG82101.1 MerR family transcriptional regulator [Rhodospirillum rubrum]HAQ00387.1 MerR family transcriptional regulator [Rhodospirillum rubrum]
MIPPSPTLEPADDGDGARRGKSESAFRTISEVSADLGVPQHVLRFWETKFSQIRPMKRGGGRRYYRPEDVILLAAIRDLLYNDGYTIKGAQKLLRENGVKSVISQTLGIGAETTAAIGAEDDEADRPDASEPEEALAGHDAPFDDAAEGEGDEDRSPYPDPLEADGDLLDGDDEDDSLGELDDPADEGGEEAPSVPPLAQAAEPVAPVVVVAGLSPSQRRELLAVLAELEDLRRILQQAEL